MRSLIAAIRFLTRLPMPGAATTAAELPVAIGWFPLVGALAGAAIAGTFIALVHWWPATIAAVLAIAVGLLLTGGFHEDAVSDAADGLGGGGERARVLAIMRDSRVGAFGVMGLWVLLTLRWAVLVAASASGLDVLMPFVLASAWGRWTAAPLLRFLPPLGDGLAKDVRAAGGSGPLTLATLLVASGSVALHAAGCPRVPAAAAVALGVTALWGLYLRRRLGGQSGDLLGAGNQLTEAAVLLTLLATPSSW
jgi:adenosylcobinamide-GDP ribazoletransferase